jgi:thiol-disulfide isomerase/thioredoxin
LEFDWSVYEDPSRPEFWDNGSPPRPLRYLAANPTIDNARKVKKWLDLQFKTLAKVTEVLSKVGGHDSKVGSHDASSLLSDAKSNDGHNLASLTKHLGIANPSELKDVKVINIYSSKCHACKKSQEVMKKLEELGVEVVHLQTDYKNGKPLYKTSQGYTEEFRDRFPHTVTPTLYVKGRKSEVEVIEEYIPFGPLYAHLSNLDAGGSK